MLMITLLVCNAAAMCETPVQLDTSAYASLIKTPTAPSVVLAAAIIGSAFINDWTCSTIPNSSFVPVITTCLLFREHSLATSAKYSTGHCRQLPLEPGCMQT